MSKNQTKFIFTLLLCLVTSTFFAQEIELSNEIKIDKEKFVGMIKADSTGFYPITRHTGNKQRALTVYFGDKDSFDLQEIAPITTIKEYEDLSVTPVEVDLINGNVLLFSIATDSKERLNYLVATSFNMKGEASHEVIDTVYGAPEPSPFRFTHQDNETIITKVEKVNDYPYVFLSVKSYNGVDIQDLASFEVPYTKKFVIDNTIVNEKHIFLGTNYNSHIKQNEANRKVENSRYILWRYDRESGRVIEDELKFKDRWMRDIHFTSKNDELCVAGTYANTPIGEVHGYFYVHYNSNFISTYADYKPFKIDFVKLIEGKSKHNGIEDFNLMEVLITDDGNVFLVIEQYYKQVSRNYEPSSDMTFYSENFYNLSMGIISIQMNGVENFQKAVVKSQKSTNDDGYFLGYSSVLWNNKLYLFFNDHVKNITEPGHKSFVGPKESVPVMVSITSSGTLKKQQLLEPWKGYIFHPESATYFKDVSYLSILKPNSFGIIKVTLP